MEARTMRATTEEQTREIWDKRKDLLLKLHGKLAHVAWEFCKIDIMNFMDTMGRARLEQATHVPGIQTEVVPILLQVDVERMGHQGQCMFHLIVRHDGPSPHVALKDHDGAGYVPEPLLVARALSFYLIIILRVGIIVERKTSDTGAQASSTGQALPRELLTRALTQSIILSSPRV